MDSVKQWLEAIGLGEYSEIFEKQKIGFRDLPHLTEVHLKEMGLLLGPRIRLLDELSKLPANSTRKPTDAVLRARTSQEGQELHADAQRRQVTAIFCDLVDFTGLLSRHDPEDLVAPIGSYIEACRTIIESYGGSIGEGDEGDGVLAFFGMPAVENAAEQAIEAGLDVIEEVKSIRGPDASLYVRVGISTGIVLVTKTDRSGKPLKAMGKAINLAHRLQSIAQPNTVLISKSTSSLVSKRFDQEWLGPRNLKGIDEPFEVFRIHGVRDDVSRFEAAQAEKLTPLVGRSPELEFLKERWREVKAGGGQTVVVSGVAGIGKSRIVHEFEKSLESDTYITLRFQCFPHGKESAFLPVIRQLERWAQIETSDSALDKEAKLKMLLSGDSNAHDSSRFITQITSLAGYQRHDARDRTRRDKVQALSVLADRLFSLGEKIPVICFLEDAQWIDPSTQELLDLISERMGVEKILMLVTCRPEYLQQAMKLENVTLFTISRPSERDIGELVHRYLGDSSITNDIVNKIVVDSGRIPLHAEELARGVKERKNHILNSAGEFHKPEARAVPASLHDSLMIRLDRVPQARQVAQLASVIGREFSYKMLAKLSDINEAELKVALSQLERGDVIRKVENVPLVRYEFKHSLVCDAAYASFPKSKLRDAHATVGAMLREDWPDIVAGQPELIAYHYGHAENAELALEFWERGGKLARSRFANLEASQQFQEALKFLRQLPETPLLKEKELEIQLTRGVCCAAAAGYYAKETRQAYERAESICKDFPNSGKALQARFGLWAHHWMRGEHVQASKLVNDFFSSPKNESDPVAMVVSNRVEGCTLFTLGEFSRAKPALENAIQITKSSGLARLASSYTVEPRIAAQLMLSWDLWFLGFPKAAIENVEDALEVATQHEDPYSIAFAQYVVSVIHFLRGSMQLSLKYAKLSHSVSTDYKINLYAIYSQFGRGCANAALGDHQTALADIGKGIEDAKSYGLGYMRAFMLSRLAAVQKQIGDPDSAMVTLDEAGKFVGNEAGRAWESEIVRMRGDFIIASDPQATAEAERQFIEAMAIARRQEARSLELRAAISLARLRQSQGKFRLAHEELSSSYGWFSEGFETADLQEGQQLISDLVRRI